MTMVMQVQSVSPAAHAAPVGESQTSPAQQALVVEQDCPTSGQVTMPASGPPVDTVPQVPVSAPGGTLHTSPWQQSDVAVHMPPCATHWVPQRYTPMLSGRQGAPLQHSAEKVQTWPAMMQQGGWPV
jgi:hypothetical protein